MFADVAASWVILYDSYTFIEGNFDSQAGALAVVSENMPGGGVFACHD